MANDSASSIRSALNTHLSAVSELKSVDSGRSMDFASGFPSCRYYLVGIENELKDNAPTNFRTYQYAIEILQPVVAGSESTNEADFQDAVDAVLDKLNTEWTLSSNVDVADLQAGDVTYAEFPFGEGVSCIIRLNARTLIS